MAPLTTSQRRALVAVVVGGLLLRIAWAVVAGREPRGFHDPAFYRLLAVQLADLDGYILEGRPTAYYPIGYPAALGAVFFVGHRLGFDTSRAETAMTIGLNLAAATAAILLAFALGRRVAGAGAGIAGAALVAVTPNLVFHTAVPLSETVFIALILGFAVVLAGGPPLDRRRIVAAGALLGAAALVRPIALPVLPLLGLVWWSARVPWRRALAQLAALGAVAAAVIAPWTIRNAIRMDAFVPISTNTGDNLCMSRQPGATGGFFLTDHCFAGDDLAGLVRPEYEIRRDAKGRRLALEFVRQHPAQELRLWAGRLGATLRHDHDGLDAVEGYGDDRFLGAGERDVYRRAADGFWYLLGGAGLAATVAVVATGRLRRDPGLVLLVAVAVGLLVPVVLFFGDARFKVPTVPFLAVLVPCVAARLRRSPRPR